MAPGFTQLLLLVNILWLNCTMVNKYTPGVCVRPKKKLAKIEKCEPDSVGKTVLYFSPGVSSDLNSTKFDFVTKTEKVGNFDFRIVDIEKIKENPNFLEGAHKIWRLSFFFNNVELNEDVTNTLLRIIETDDNLPIKLKSLHEIYNKNLQEHVHDEIDLKQCYKIISVLGEKGIKREKAMQLLSRLLLYAFSDQVSLPRHYCCNEYFQDFVAKNIMYPSLYSGYFYTQAVKFFLNNDEPGDYIPKVFECAVMRDDIGFIMSFMTFHDFIKKIQPFKAIVID